MIVYLHNILIFSRTKEKYFTTLNKVFKSLAKLKLVLNKSKFTIFLKLVMFLGYVVSAEGVNMYKGKIAPV